MDFYYILESFLTGGIIVVVAWLIIAYCQSEFYDSDDDGDETTY